METLVNALFMSGNQKKPAGGGTSNRDWWPNELKLNILRQNATFKSNPMGSMILIMLKHLKVLIMRVKTRCY